MRLRCGFTPLIFILFCGISLSQASIRYTISLADPEHHLVRVTVEIPPGRDAHELQLPVWNALYQVRDFSQNMNWIRATKQDQSGQPISLIQVNSSRWKLTGAERGARIDYEMFTDSHGSFGAQFNSHHAFLNLAQVLLYADDTRSQPTADRISQPTRALEDRHTPRTIGRRLHRAELRPTGGLARRNRSL